MSSSIQTTPAKSNSSELQPSPAQPKLFQILINFLIYFFFKADNICKGKIDKSIYAEAKLLQKTLKGMNESLQKQFEILDSLTLTEDQQGSQTFFNMEFFSFFTSNFYDPKSISECKQKRKTVAVLLNQTLDNNEAVLEKMNQWIKVGLS